MSVTIRRAVPDDLPRLAEMMAATDPWRHFRYDAEECLGRLAPHLNQLHVAVDGGRLLGFVRVSEDSPLSGVDLRFLCVDAAFRDRGLGTRLVTYVRDVLYPHDSVNLTVSDCNPNARRLYRRLGFEQVGLIPSYNFAGEDEYVMRFHRGPKRQHLVP